MSSTNAELANHRMVDRLIAEGALWSPRLIAAFHQTPRHRFLRRVFVFHQRPEGWRDIDTSEPSDKELDLLYSDRALITRLASGADRQQVPVSSSSQPSLMAEMLEDLRPQPGQRVLEIGAGTGYNAALLAHIVGPDLVHAVDVDGTVVAEAAENLEGFGERGVQLHHGDGREGWQAAAPFDRIMVTAATPDLEPAWLAQTHDDGILEAPLVLAPGLAFVVRGHVRRGVFQGELTRGAYFMPLRTEDEAPQEEQESMPSRGPLKTRPAPWSGWFDRQRPRLGWSGFLQALVFYGLLRGLTVLQNSGTSAYGSHGVQAEGEQCWFSSEDWQVTSAAGQELGETLWQAWLAAGGPWPTDFTLEASATEELTACGHECYGRRGLRCWQVWRLKEDRQRPGWR